jgi:ElaB/YqjD/DUF883 family membrane-anchored ribosome-binding protein
MVEQSLPEGTDTIIDGAGVGDEDDLAQESVRQDDPAASAGDVPPPSSGASANEPSSGGTSEQGSGFVDRIQGLRGQAEDRARDLAQAGKDRALAALDDVVRMVEDAAAEIDDKIGHQYGDYARRAADGIGSLGNTFRDKDVDQLFDDARALVAKAPAVAVGVAAAVGFVVARLARAGTAEVLSTNDAPKA